MRSDPVWSSDYFGGLQVIKKAISERLESAGANLGDGCLTHPVVSRVDGHPPPKLAITVVPFNGPRMGGIFTAQDFLHSTLAADPQALAKVDLYVLAFRKFREGGVRHILGGSHPVPDSPGPGFAGPVAGAEGNGRNERSGLFR
jgi:hypothetical protein